MLYLDGLGGLFLLALWVFCFIDVLLTPDTAVRNLPKLAWVFIVLLLSTIGSIAWLVAGRPWDRTNVAAGSRPSNRSPEYDRSNRFVPSNPDDDEEFLAGLRKRAEEQRRRARDAQREQDDKPDSI
jgi:phospholipase D-like protein